MNATSSKSSKVVRVNLTYRAAQQAIGLIVLFVALLFILPSGQDGLQAYHFSNLEYKVIKFAINLPALLLWLAAFVGYATLRQYALSLRGTPEAGHFDRLATGTTWLAWSLPITALVSLVLGSMAYEWHGLHAFSIIVSNYVTLVLPLVAFSIIGIASRGLIGSAKIKLGLGSARAIVLAFLLVGVLYCYFTFRHFDLSDIGSAHNPYHLPIWLMVITVIVPYLYAWFIGLLATYEITLLSQQVRGVLYRRALQLLVGGLGTIIISSIALQYLNGVTPHPDRLVFDYKLVLEVLFRIIGGIGYLLMTLGALRLKKIEEV